MIEPLTLIEALSKFTDLLTKSKEFFGTFESEKKKLFRKYIDPAFTDMQPVLRQYRDDMVSFREDLSKVYDYMSARLALDSYIEKRRRLVLERTKLLSALKATSHHWVTHTKHDPGGARSAFIHFLSQLMQYFGLPPSRVVDGSEQTFDDYHITFFLSDASNLIEQITMLIAPYKHKKNIAKYVQKTMINYIDVALSQIEQRSLFVYDSFAELKMKCNESR